MRREGEGGRGGDPDRMEGKKEGRGRKEEDEEEEETRRKKGGEGAELDKREEWK